ncbi:MAG TPA: LpxD N-terminal domain-containing protein, partial [Candidatus Omnitrophota bacterium]|nr:LpxD N-terminal domain-containing protein [Candidatus Omnitrophota bacterium]
MKKTAREIAQFISGEIAGDSNTVVSGINGINEAGESDLAFVFSEEYASNIASSRAGCVVIPKSVKFDGKKCVIKVDDPKVAFSKVMAAVLPEKFSHPKGIHNTSAIAKSAKLGSGVAIGPYVVVEEGVVIGDGSVIYPFCYVGARTKIGKNCVFYPNVVLREDITIGDRVTIHACSVIGSDGFGYDTQKDGTHAKIPQ